MILVGSYPRSGNHALRFFLEFVFARGSLGCVGNVKDLPLSQNKYPGGFPLAHVKQLEFIARKLHFAEEYAALSKLAPASDIVYQGAVVILRPPVLCITSHLMKTLNIDELDVTKLSIEVDRELEKWVNLLVQLRDIEICCVDYDEFCSEKEAVRFAKYLEILVFLQRFERFSQINVDIFFRNSQELLEQSRQGEGRDWGGVTKEHHQGLQNIIKCRIRESFATLANSIFDSEIPWSAKALAASVLARGVGGYERF